MFKVSFLNEMGAQLNLLDFKPGFYAVASAKISMVVESSK